MLGLNLNHLTLQWARKVRPRKYSTQGNNFGSISILAVLNTPNTTLLKGNQKC